MITAAAAIVIGGLHLLRAEYAVRGARLAASSRSDARTASLSATMQIVPLTTALDWHLQLAAGSGCGSETHVPLAKLPVHAAPVSATRCMCGPFDSRGTRMS